MARTTADLVKAVLAPGLDYDLVRNPSLDPFISMATNLVDRVATCATSAGNPHSSPPEQRQLRRIVERLLSDQPLSG